MSGLTIYHSDATASIAMLIQTVIGKVWLEFSLAPWAASLEKKFA
jgi:hypothetical protein